VCGQGKVAQAGGSTCRHQDFPSAPGNVRRRETGDYGKQPEIHLPQFEEPATTTCVNANERENANILIDFD